MKKCEISNTWIQNLGNAETGNTQITQAASIPHSYMNSLHIKIFFLFLGQGALQEERSLDFHPSAQRKGGLEMQGKISRVLRIGLTVHSSILW